jgi:phosphohistidine phosphatase
VDLILWRHAEAEIASSGMDDLSRRLTPKGERQATRMAAWLDRHLPEGTRILVSPARRTHQTALALGRKFKLRDDLVPTAQADDILQLLKWSPESGPQIKGSVLVVGHQPYLGQVIAQLLGMNESACSVRKGAVWWLRSRLRDEQWQTVVMAVASPELHTRAGDDLP